MERGQHCVRRDKGRELLADPQLEPRQNFTRGFMSNYEFNQTQLFFISVGSHSQITLIHLHTLEDVWFGRPVSQKASTLSSSKYET